MSRIDRDYAWLWVIIAVVAIVLLAVVMAAYGTGA